MFLSWRNFYRLVANIVIYIQSFNSDLALSHVQTVAASCSKKNLFNVCHFGLETVVAAWSELKSDSAEEEQAA